MEQRVRASPEQFNALIEFMERHGDLARPQPGAQGRARSDRLWQQLVALLNSIGSGIDKTVDKWKKVWADWKTKTKKKHLTIRTHASGTGGGPNSRLTLTALEERVVAVLGVSAVMGQAGVQELGLDRPSVTQSHEVEENEDILHDPLSFEFPESPSPPPATRSYVFPPVTMPMPDSMPSPSPPLLSPPPPLSPEPSPLPPPPPPPPPRPRARPRVRPRGSQSQPSPAPPHSLPGPSRRRRRPSASPRSTATTPRRLLQRTLRRNRGDTPFERAAAAFVAVENRRLELEEARIQQEEAREQRFFRLEEARLQQEEARGRREHDLATERLCIETDRVAAERQRNVLLQQLGNIVERALETQGRNNVSLASTDLI